MPKKINLNLDQLAQGGVQELFDMNVKKVLENVQDLNTEPKVKRKMTITIDFIPDETRRVILLDSNVKVSLAPVRGVVSTVLAGKNAQGEIEANELLSQVPGQTYIDFETGKIKSDIGESLEQPKEPQQNKKVVDLQAKNKKA